MLFLLTRNTYSATPKKVADFLYPEVIEGICCRNKQRGPL